MEAVLPRAAVWRAPFERIDWRAVGIWALAGGLVLYLAIDGGGYDIVAHSQVAIVVWWIVLVGAACGLLPAARISRAGWAALILFGGFVAWTALGATWSLSSERSLADLSLVAGYLGVLVLGILVHSDRERALRQTMAALATAIVIVAALALASRLHPGLFPAAAQTASFLAGTSRRLGWPLNYWNALAALLALSLPLLLGIATSARTLWGQALAAAAIPLVALCGYLTFSRGGALAGAVAIVVFILLAPERLPKLATGLVAAAGSAALVAGASHRSALEQGLLNAVARHQGGTLVLPIVLVCAGVAATQVGIGLATRHGTPPKLLVVSPRQARWLSGAAAVVIVAAALAAGASGKLSHAWRDFKNPAPALSQESLSRFGTLSGNGRYDYWRVAVYATSNHVLNGSGPGTYQLLWLPRAPYYSYVVNAHSLYFETYAELGLVGVVLLVGFFAVVVGSALSLVIRSRYEARTRAAAVTAALAAFIVSAAFDWIWQLPALPVSFLLLAAAVLAPPLARNRVTTGRWTLPLARVGIVAVSIALLVAIAVPLATTSDVRASQAAAAQGNRALALRDAENAARVEPGAASPQIQLALVEELQGDLPAALAASTRAVNDEPQNWTAWLILARLEAENRHPKASLAAYERSRSLNPHSPVFADASRA